jgi:hypothetical protein
MPAGIGTLARPENPCFASSSSGLPIFTSGNSHFIVCRVGKFSLWEKLFLWIGHNSLLATMLPECNLLLLLRPKQPVMVTACKPSLRVEQLITHYILVVSLLWMFDFKAVAKVFTT